LQPQENDDKVEGRLVSGIACYGRSGNIAGFEGWTEMERREYGGERSERHYILRGEIDKFTAMKVPRPCPFVLRVQFGRKVRR
jgi:hypothetical protein